MASEARYEVQVFGKKDELVFEDSDVVALNTDHPLHLSLTTDWGGDDELVTYLFPWHRVYEVRILKAIEGEA